MKSSLYIYIYIYLYIKHYLFGQLYISYVTPYKICQHVTNMFPTWYEYVSNMIQTCFQHVTNMFPTCNEHVSNMLRTMCQHVTNMFPTWYDHQNKDFSPRVGPENSNEFRTPFPKGNGIFQVKQGGNWNDKVYQFRQAWRRLQCRSCTRTAAHCIGNIDNRKGPCEYYLTEPWEGVKIHLKPILKLWKRKQ